MTEPDPERWRRWRWSDAGGTRAFMNQGASYGGFDAYVFGVSELELRVSLSQHLYLVNQRTEEALASCPLPETLEETVAWARMVAAIHAADRDPRDDGYPF